jgi:hypothetical protein
MPGVTAGWLLAVSYCSALFYSAQGKQSGLRDHRIESVGLGAQRAQARPSAWEPTSPKSNSVSVRAEKTDSQSETDRQRPEKIQDRAQEHQSQEF